MSYRRLVLHDFSNAIDDYSIRNCTEKDRSEYALFLDFVSHVNLIRDAVDDDEKDVLLFNFVAVGGVLNQFIIELSRDMVSVSAFLLKLHARALFSYCPPPPRISHRLRISQTDCNRGGTR